MFTLSSPAMDFASYFASSPNVIKVNVDYPASSFYQPVFSTPPETSTDKLLKEHQANVQKMLETTLFMKQLDPVKDSTVHNACFQRLLDLNASCIAILDKATTQLTPQRKSSSGPSSSEPAAAAASSSSAAAVASP